jgi:hypothetical protein
MTTPVLELSTEVLPAEKLLVDGTEYDLYTFDHLSAEDEAVVTAIFSRFQSIYRALNRTNDQRKREKQAALLRTTREELIDKMTSIPKDEIKSLPVSAQGKLLNAIRENISEDADDDDLEEGTDEEDEEALLAG